jgi:hypothetical protein
MSKTTLLGSALAVALSAAPAMAGDFHALAALQGATPAPLQDGVLAATEGGQNFCFTPGGSSATTAVEGGVVLCAELPPFAAFSVSNQLPVTAAQFLQVHGLIPAP